LLLLVRNTPLLRLMYRTLRAPQGIVQQEEVTTMLDKQNFGILRRRWSRFDHLDIFGHNEVDKNFFMLDSRQVNTALKTLTGDIIGPHHPLARAMKLVAEYNKVLKQSAEFDYVGTLKVKNPAISNRHFVSVRIQISTEDGRPSESFWKNLGYIKLDMTKLESQIGNKYSPIIGRWANDIQQQNAA